MSRNSKGLTKEITMKDPIIFIDPDKAILIEFIEWYTPDKQRFHRGMCDLPEAIAHEFLIFHDASTVKQTDQVEDGKTEAKNIANGLITP